MVTRRLLRRAAICAGVIEVLALLIALYWRDDGLSLHGGNAPEPVFLYFWATQIGGYYLTTVWLGIHHGPLLFLLALVLLSSGALWTVVFASLALVWKGLLGIGRLARGGAPA